MTLSRWTKTFCDNQKKNREMKPQSGFFFFLDKSIYILHFVCLFFVKSELLFLYMLIEFLCMLILYIYIY